MSISPTIKRSQRSESLFELEDLVLKFQAFSPVNEEGDSEKTLDSRTSTRATTVFSSCSSRELKRPTPIIMQTPYGVFSPVTPSDSVREKRFMRISPELPEREVKEEAIDTKKRGREEYDLDSSAVTEVSDLSDRIFSARKIRKIH
jgi:hypothetical protein